MLINVSVVCMHICNTPSFTQSVHYGIVSPLLVWGAEDWAKSMSLGNS